MSKPTRIALVTGAGRGLGLEVARQLLVRGVQLLLGVRTATAAATELVRSSGGMARLLPLDVTDAASVDSAKQLVERELGHLDILVNNAAVHYDTWQTASTVDMVVVQEAIDTNLMGPWRMSKAFAPLMGWRDHGVIVNVSSGGGALASINASTPAYSVSKAALNAMTISLAADLRAKGVLVNAVCPGWVATDMGGPGGRPVADGAAGITWAALMDRNGPTGKFFRDRRELSWFDG